ncbi:MAG: dNTP triphosphohydrolase [Gemmataceae bacterium]|nr:dNTP triphosphohydrolase [Gemmataceae bacterium]
MTPQREDRLSKEPESDAAKRSAFRRDRDRILYAGAFRRLVGVTQVIGPSDGEVFHNRLTHTLKVAQVARRFAERFTADPATKKNARRWRIDADAVEAASLAHDLGHPPFGHVAERELADLVRPLAGADAFEGNAQSFRIVTRLAVRRHDRPPGLDLARATLDAVLKYPWLPSDEIKKYGAYREDKEAFEFARASHEAGDDTPSPEAQIMDWADDITYSVHDTEDFYRAGLVPLHLLAVSDTERDSFLDRAIKRRAKEKKKPFSLDGETADLATLKTLFSTYCSRLLVREPYSGTRSQRGLLAHFTSMTVASFDQATTLRPPGEGRDCLEVPDEYKLLVALLKELIGVYVIDNPALAAQEHGQRQVVAYLFKAFYDAATDRQWKLFPPQFRDEAEDILEKQGDITPPRCARLAADTIASMTDGQALRMHQRLTGQSLGPALDPIMS